MSSETRQILAGIEFPETTVFSDRYNEYLMKPGKAVQLNMEARSATPVSCIFAGPEGILLSPVHFEVKRGGAIQYFPVLEGEDITDTISLQRLEPML